MIFHYVDIRYYTLSKYVGILGELGWLLKMGLIMIWGENLPILQKQSSF
jgi:hypothetical protein